MTSDWETTLNFTQSIYSSTSTNLWINRSVLVVYFVFGFVGNLLNIILFTRPILLRSSTSIYLLSASIGNMFVIVLVLPLRFLADGFHLDPTDFSTVSCRLISYIYHICLALPPLFNVLACADRWAASSLQATRRQFANVQRAKRLVPWTIFFSSLIYSYILFTFIREATPPPPFCSVDKKHALFVLSFYLIIYTILPPASMIFFSISIILNVYRKDNRRNTTQRVAFNQNGLIQDRRHRGLSPMQLMLVCQAVIECFFTLPFIVINFVSMMVDNDQEFLNLYAFIRLLIFFNYVSSFYVYTLSSNLYRTQLRQLFLSFYQR